MQHAAAHHDQLHMPKITSQSSAISLANYISVIHHLLNPFAVFRNCPQITLKPTTTPHMQQFAHLIQLGPLRAIQYGQNPTTV
jgi:hypothetical protein